jgi:hypothetical protein
MAITTSSSINVNPGRVRVLDMVQVPLVDKGWSTRVGREARSNPSPARAAGHGRAIVTPMIATERSIGSHAERRRRMRSHRSTN